MKERSSAKAGELTKTGGLVKADGLAKAGGEEGSAKALVVTRKEIKYQLNPVQYCRLSQALKNVMVEDPHNGAGGYRIRSLYFDSYVDTDYYQKLAGEENRKKIRLRTYSTDAQKVKLEIKRKYNTDQVKKSVLISREDAIALIDCDYEVLRKYDSPTAAMIYEIMHINRVRPVVIVEYRRKAYIHPVNNIRITLDAEIRSTETNFDFFSSDLVLTPAEPFAFALAEVKFNGFIMGWLTELLSHYDLNRSSYSKYTVSRTLFEQYMS